MENILPFWKHLTEQQKNDLLSCTTLRTVPAQTTLYSGASECVGIAVVKTGSLRVYITSLEGKEITLFRLYPNEICVLSASCLLDSITFDVSIQADAASEIYVIPSAFYKKLMEENIYVENCTYKLTIEKFSDVMWTMEQILFMGLDQRLAIFLLDESAKTHSHPISLTHAQIAGYIGSAREAVSRMLKYFESEGILKLSRGSIEITGLDKLKAIAHSTGAPMTE